MSAETRTIHLPASDAAFVDDLVSSGRYDSTNDVISAGLEALKEREASLELWLRNEVVPAAEALEADPSLAIPAEQVFAELRARYSSARSNED